MVTVWYFEKYSNLVLLKVMQINFFCRMLALVFCRHYFLYENIYEELTITEKSSAPGS